MRVPYLLSTAIACAVAIGSYPANLSQAVQLRDGKIYFTQPPRLEEVVTTYKDVNVWGATYYFTVSIPETAGEPLQKITINQRDGVDNIRFDLKDSAAFEGTRSQRGQRVELKDVASDRKTKTVSLTFDPPLSPGKIVTIGLKPRKNPTIAGVYLFGVTAFPPGESAHGQFLGYGRLQFYNSFDSRIPF
ncbi:hypothetical protein WA1_14565 [Scytonema hofmannii PCC 7110]|uniref:DUF2808 domain-containing protein n=1 Tax=Scytonema hofmannii PCC 7110 TaxID=128403 RepID=A0A139XF27_9CYAN|nr:DUF2808 domain-containing protein [Scytonema hofmannii]KYC43305.1 hypothetical protein WA1_14565 [Scytonema hofmannii PCC 7110]